jgi:hypothetical protein
MGEGEEAAPQTGGGRFSIRHARRVLGIEAMLSAA